MWVSIGWDGKTRIKGPLNYYASQVTVVLHKYLNLNLNLYLHNRNCSPKRCYQYYNLCLVDDWLLKIKIDMLWTVKEQVVYTYRFTCWNLKSDPLNSGGSSVKVTGLCSLIYNKQTIRSVPINATQIRRQTYYGVNTIFKMHQKLSRKYGTECRPVNCFLIESSELIKEWIITLTFKP